MNWRMHAACRGKDPEIFTSVLIEDIRRAKRICRECPVTTECLELAHRTGDDWSVLGGLSAAERRGDRPRILSVKACAYCGYLFSTGNGQKRFCSETCQHRMYRESYGGGDKHRPWTDDESYALWQLTMDGVPPKIIAQRLGRTRDSVKRRRARMREEMTRQESVTWSS